MRTAAATSGPASDPRPASSQPATKRVPCSRSKRKSFAAWRRRRLTALDAGLAPLEEPDFLGRPVAEEGLADDPVLGDWSPESAVVAGATVVAHHEVMPGRDLDRFLQIAG